jgi:hypothetical protein
MWPPVEDSEDKRDLSSQEGGGPYEDVSVTFYRTVRELDSMPALLDRGKKSVLTRADTLLQAGLRSGTPLLTKGAYGHRTIEKTMRYGT